jgi:hypothetical protein
VGQLIKVRDTEQGVTRWVEVGDMSQFGSTPPDQAFLERPPTVFDGSSEPEEAQPGDFWITEE